MADKIEYGKEKDKEGTHRESADAHCPHCAEHHERLEAVEAHLGLNRKKPTADEIIRQRKRS